MGQARDILSLAFFLHAKNAAPRGTAFLLEPDYQPILARMLGFTLVLMSALTYSLISSSVSTLTELLVPTLISMTDVALALPLPLVRVSVITFLNSPMRMPLSSFPSRFRVGRGTVQLVWGTGWHWRMDVVKPPTVALISAWNLTRASVLAVRKALPAARMAAWRAEPFSMAKAATRAALWAVRAASMRVPRSA